MALIYKAHRDKECDFHKVKGGQAQHKCGCEFYTDARSLGLGRISLGTADRKTAELKALEIRQKGHTDVEKKQARSFMLLSEAQHAWFRSTDFAALAKNTKKKHRTLLAPADLRRDEPVKGKGHGAGQEFYLPGQLTLFAASYGLKTLAEMDAVFVERFRASWLVERVHPNNGRKVKDDAMAAAKKLDRFKQFCYFAERMGWLVKNPIADLKTPKVKITKKQPYTPGQVTAILDDCASRAALADSPEERDNWLRTGALALFMRYSGLRLADAVGCMKEWVTDDRVVLDSRKNGRHVDNVLPEFVVRALRAVPAESPLYFFWTGECALETATGKYHEKFAQVFESALGVEHKGRSHRFRVTFAVDMLERGHSMGDVAAALADSERIASLHYAAWSKKRQERQDAAVSSGWKSDPLLKSLERQERARRSERVVSIAGGAA